MEDMTFTAEDVIMKHVDSEVIGDEFPNGVVVTDTYASPFSENITTNYAIAWEAADSVGVAANHGEWDMWSVNGAAGISPASARALAAALLDAADRVEARIAEADSLS